VSADQLQNGLLQSLNKSDFEVLLPHLKTVDLSEELTLLEIGQTVTRAWFPHIAVVSLVMEFQTGERVEVAMIGRDSVLGAFSRVAVVKAVVLLPGTASVIEIDRLRAVADQSIALRETLIHHGQALFVQAQQTAGCNAVHTVEARLARWLLRVRDLSGGNRFKLTQELMAQMIGARRNSVSHIAHALQKANFIRYSRGHVEIIDPDGLHRTACECYEIVRAQYRRVRFPT
jgi:CRP-like cAMP-binding protein